MKQHMENGLKVAQWLEKNPRVTKVLYPRKSKTETILKQKNNNLQ
jgi:cystathionine beta-lyase/cystathionine gamma-synthase